MPLTLSKRRSAATGTRAWPPREHALAGAIAGVVTVLVWILYGVSGGAIVRFVAYELLYVLAPGVLAYASITRTRRWDPTHLAVGWALGFALEIAAFSATALADVRWLFSLYPLVTVALAVMVRVRPAESSGPASARSPQTPRRLMWPWALLLVFLLLVGYLVSDYFAATPLPWQLAHPISYDQDHVWELSLVAEALRHFPLQIPNLSGATLHYHYFAYLHLAAIAQVTHLPISLIVFRLDVLVMVVAVMTGIFALGRSLGSGHNGVGVCAVVLALVIGPFNPWPTPPSEFFTHLFEGPSASYSMGLVLLLAVLTELSTLIRGRGDDVRSTGRAPIPWRRLAVVAVLMAGCAGAKVVILPMLLTALAASTAILWLSRRLQRPRALIVPLGVPAVTTALAAVIFVVSFVVLYRGASQPIHIQPFTEINLLEPFHYLRGQFSAFAPAQWLTTALAVVVETLKVLAPLAVGLLGIALARSISPMFVVIGVLLLVGIVGDYAIFDPHGSQVYFLYYGYVPAAAAAAVGLMRVWEAIGARITIRPRAFAAVAVATLLVWGAEGPIGSRPGEPTSPPLWAYLEGIRPPDTNLNLTPKLYAGLRWIATHTPTSAVLAVNNRWQDPASQDARYCYYSAFAQRSVMLECDIGTSHIDQYLSLSGSLAVPNSGPYPARTTLNTDLFHFGEAGALAEAIHRYGVSYLVIDLVHLEDANVPAVLKLGTVVYRNPNIIVIKV